MHFKVYRYAFGRGKQIDYIRLGDFTHTHVDGLREFRTMVLDLTSKKTRAMATSLLELYSEFVRVDTFQVSHLTGIIRNTSRSENPFADEGIHVFANFLNKKRLVAKLEKCYLIRKEASVFILNQFRDSISNPKYKMCRNRLFREFNELQC
jgi:hypothetical protein